MLLVLGHRLQTKKKKSISKNRGDKLHVLQCVWNKHEDGILNKMLHSSEYQIRLSVISNRKKVHDISVKFGNEACSNGG